VNRQNPIPEVGDHVTPGGDAPNSSSTPRNAASSPPPCSSSSSSSSSSPASTSSQKSASSGVQRFFQKIWGRKIESRNSVADSNLSLEDLQRSAPKGRERKRNHSCVTPSHAESVGSLEQVDDDHDGSNNGSVSTEMFASGSSSCSIISSSSLQVERDRGQRQSAMWILR